jgi:hypothetical protein
LKFFWMLELYRLSNYLSRLSGFEKVFFKEIISSLDVGVKQLWFESSLCHLSVHFSEAYLCQRPRWKSFIYLFRFLRSSHSRNGHRLISWLLWLSHNRHGFIWIVYGRCIVVAININWLCLCWNSHTVVSSWVSVYCGIFFTNVFDLLNRFDKVICNLRSHFSSSFLIRIGSAGHNFIDSEGLWCVNYNCAWCHV